MIKDFNSENVIYLELRTTPRYSADSFTKYDYLQTVLKTIEKCKDKYKIKVRLIPSIDRAQGVSSAEETLNIILKLKNEYNHLIVGVDLSGDPEKGSFKMYKKVFEIARENHLKLAFHCGENPNSDDESLEMINFGVDRIGHGTFINDENLNIILKRKIAVECCLTSNLKCRTINTYNNHHFMKLFNNNHIVVLCVSNQFYSYITHI